MLRRDRALLESLTKKYGRKILNEHIVNNNPLCDFRLNDFEIDQPTFVIINTANYPGDAGVLVVRCDDNECFYNYGFDDAEIERFSNMNIGDIEYSDDYYKDEVIIIRIS